MTQTIRRFLVLMALAAALAPIGLGQTTDPIGLICATSQDLTSYSGTIRMTRHEARSDSVIEFTFDFVPADQMRIVYTAPATVVGQTMILNADQFYTYIPSLHRSVWQEVTGSGGNQGEEMGFLYDFVTQSASTVLEQADVQVAENRETFMLEVTDEELEVYVLTLSQGEERQVVLINVVDGAPVAVSVYNGDDLAMEIRVLDYQINGDFDESWFAIPEK
jgi:outer membrane lipoprotein-sorting protein